MREKAQLYPNRMPCLPKEILEWRRERELNTTKNLRDLQIPTPMEETTWMERKIGPRGFEFD